MPKSETERLLENRRRYVGGAAMQECAHPGKQSISPSKRTAVLACMGARVDVEELLRLRCLCVQPPAFIGFRGPPRRLIQPRTPRAGGGSGWSGPCAVVYRRSWAIRGFQPQVGLPRQCTDSSAT